MSADLTVYPRWLVMWLLAVAIYSACKLLTFREVTFGTASTARSIAYLMFWPGMGAREFLNREKRVMSPTTTQWLRAVLRVLLGICVLWVLIRRVPTSDELLRGWLGMFGLILVLHFGIFELLALGFRAAGIDAHPLMNKPLLSRSVAEFWNKRWNVAFNQLAHRLIFRRVVGRIGMSAAVLLTFGCSGIVHDVVISVPAGGGYGLPTAYFLFQGVAVLVERSDLGRSILQNGAGGRVFTILVTAGPAFWLFHPMFVRNVMLPFLHAIGCL